MLQDLDLAAVADNPAIAVAAMLVGGLEPARSMTMELLRKGKDVVTANKAVSNAEAIKKFVLVPDEWTEESGQMTPSMKLKRGVVLKEYEAQIEEIYA